MIVVPNPYAKAPCKASKTIEAFGVLAEHIHTCTGPVDHGGEEHFCECEVWWKK